MRCIAAIRLFTPRSGSLITAPNRRQLETVHHFWTWFAHGPSSVEAVAWAAGRKDVLSAFFCLASINAYLLWILRKSRWLLLASLLLFACGLLAKVSVIMVPFVLLLIWFLTFLLNKSSVYATDVVTHYLDRLVPSHDEIPNSPYHLLLNQIKRRLVHEHGRVANPREILRRDVEAC